MFSSALIILVSLFLSSTLHASILQSRQAGTRTVTTDTALISAANDPTCGTVVVPKGLILTVFQGLNFTGIQDKHFSIQGNIQFVSNVNFWVTNALTVPGPILSQTQRTFWIISGKNILIDGGGSVSGSGAEQPWFAAYARDHSIPRPIILTLYQSSNVTVQDVQFNFAPKWHHLISQSNDIRYNHSFVITSATSTSPIDLDGWVIHKSDNVAVTNTVAGNAGNCVSILQNSTNILASSIIAFGSGMSIGPIGGTSGAFDFVENVLMTGISVFGPLNAAIIQSASSPTAGSGLVRNVTFSGFQVDQARIPIVIDQCFQGDETYCDNVSSNTLIQDVTFNNITGTTTGIAQTTVASLACSPGGTCNNIVVNDLSLSPPSQFGSPLYSCQNLNLSGNSAGLFGSCVNTGLGIGS